MSLLDECDIEKTSIGIEEFEKEHLEHIVVFKLHFSLMVFFTGQEVDQRFEAKVKHISGHSLDSSSYSHSQPN